MQSRELRERFSKLSMFWLKANFRGLKEKKIHTGCRVAIENKFIPKKKKKSEGEENEV